MGNEHYGLTKHEAPALPVISLLRVPYQNTTLVASWPAFSPNTFLHNLAEMKKTYFHSRAFPEITFRELSTDESIAVAAYDFGNLAKPSIFNPHWLQAGRIIRAPEGVIANPPRDKTGNVILNREALPSYIEKAKQIPVGNGYIYLGDNSFGMADYKSFSQGVQDCDTFVEGGLARVLEHSEGPAENLRKIASSDNYPRGVNVWAFDEVKESIERVVRLYSDGGVDGDRLNVGGDDCYDNGVGCVFGGLVSGEARTKNSA